jgi:AbiJ-like protein
MDFFSERIGAKPPKTVLQLNSMDDDLRNGLWNVCYDSQLKHIQDRYFDSQRDDFTARLWRQFFKLPADEIPLIPHELLNHIKTFYFAAPWFRVYDFVEFTAGFPNTSEQFRKKVNQVLQRERSGYHFIGYRLLPITSEDELSTIQDAMQLPEPLKPVRFHLETSVKLFSDRKNPDYRNSIKESISAVESICKIITGLDNTELGDALKRLEDKGIDLHKALKKAFLNLYGYTNDAEGIRHALLDEPTLDFDDAKFMLVSCSAFVNYLAAKATKAGCIQRA